MSKGYKRRNFFIKQDFQGKVILTSFLVILAGGLLFSLLLAIFSSDSLTVVYRNNDLQLGGTPAMLAGHGLLAFWVFMLLGGGLVAVLALLVSHRTAGPLFRFERALDSMNKGRLNDTIHLRKKDTGKELAEKINTFNLMLSGKLTDLDHHAAEIERLLSEMEKTAPASSGQQDMTILRQEVERQTQAIREITRSFQTADEK